PSITMQTTTRKFGRFTLRYHPYTLGLRHVFTIAAGSRSTTPIVLTELEYEGIIGYGEASMPPYLGESHETVLAFLNRVELSGFINPFIDSDNYTNIDRLALKNKYAKKAVHIEM